MVTSGNSWSENDKWLSSEPGCNWEGLMSGACPGLILKMRLGTFLLHVVCAWSKIAVHFIHQILYSCIDWSALNQLKGRAFHHWLAIWTACHLWRCVSCAVKCLCILFTSLQLWFLHWYSYGAINLQEASHHPLAIPTAFHYWLLVTFLWRVLKIRWLCFLFTRF